MKKNICIDVRSLTDQPSGVGRYIKQLVTHIFKLNTSNYSFFLLGSDNQFKLFKHHQNYFNFLKCDIDFTKHPQTEWWLTYKLPKIISKNKIDLFHATAFTAPLISPNIPWVSTIHDMVYADLPQKVPLKFRWYLALQTYFNMRNATAIITMSQFTKKRILHHFNKMDPGKIKVISLGAEKNELKIQDNKLNTPKPFILYVGNIEPRKGILDLIKSYEYYCKLVENPYELTICGKPLWNSDSIMEGINQSPVRNKINIKGFVSDDQLFNLYQQASLKVIPSSYEGFGLPLLESMRGQSPILVNDIEVFREIGENLVHYIPFNQYKKVGEKIKSLLKQPLVSNESFSNHLQKYSWENCSQQTLDLYGQILNQ